MPTKLGAHVLRAAPGLGEFIQARPAVLKFAGDWGRARDVPEGVLTVGRKIQAGYDAQAQRQRGLSPRTAVERFVQDQLETYRSNPQIKYWEGHNEPVWNNEAGMAWYADFEIERMKLMSELGFNCVIGNFASGTPPLDLWPVFLPALQTALEYESILGLHEYSCPWMWWMTGSHQLDPDEHQGDEGWATLRYRKVYRQHLLPHGLKIPVAITECGIDALAGPKPAGVRGGTWKQLGDFWAEHDGEPDKAAYYFRQLAWYDKELQKDDYVVGAAIFTWGSFGPPWSYFDVAGTGVAKKLIAHAEDNPAERFEYSKYCRTDGDRTRGHPRAQYERTYVLLPPTADAAWARCVVNSAWEQRDYTIGISADDAGIGDLDVRRVIAVNPEEWTGPLSLADFYERYYPGVAYKAVTAATPAELEEKLASE